jgi:hypothetical protein
LIGEAGYPDQIMIDSTYLKAPRTAASLRKKPAPAAGIGRIKSELILSCMPFAMAKDDLLSYS